MKIATLCSLALLALATGPALHAQDARIPARGNLVEADSTVLGTPASAATTPEFLPATVHGATPLAIAAVPGVALSGGEGAALQESSGGLKNFFFGSQRRTSNTLMIGGVSFAGIGVGVVKGDVGALMGVAGLLASIGGLYLAF